jgi:hypothetical protein
LIEDYHSTNPGGETIGLSVTWWDENEQGFRALWCVNRNPRGCTVMSKLAKWEGKKLVLGDEFERNGKKVAFKEVVSPVSSTS